MEDRSQASGLMKLNNQTNVKKEVAYSSHLLQKPKCAEHGAEKGEE